MLNREILHLSVPSKTAAWAPEFGVEDLPLSRTAALVPELAVKHLPYIRSITIAIEVFTSAQVVLSTHILFVFIFSFFF